ncbi:hypothetical protein GGF46_001255 [Coemansia sp. RSA 552]|nr:hypothetical protein GGF46_001255 [Coemansia sp. RSA 552]
MDNRSNGSYPTTNAREPPRLSQSHSLSHAASRTTARSREYEGFFSQHPARDSTGTSMSVVVPDMPTPLGSAPAAMAYKHDRRRDYFTDSSTLEAAMGKSAPRDAGIRYNIREHSSAEPTEITTTAAAATGRVTSPTVYHIGADAKSAGAAARRTREAASRSTSIGQAPFFHRIGSSAHADAGHGSGSHLPRFMRERLHGTASLESGSGRSSVASSESLVHSPGSAASASAMQGILELEEARLLEAERKTQLRAVDGVLSEEQKIAYVGLVYLLLVDMQNRLNVRHKESQSSTASFMNFSRRLMRNMYAHIRLSTEEQRMIELLPRHRVGVGDMAHSLAAQGDTILVEADQDLAIMHAQADDELIDALRSSPDCRSSAESSRGSAIGWFRGRSSPAEEDIYTQYSMLPTEGLELDDRHAPAKRGAEKEHEASADSTSEEPGAVDRLASDTTPPRAASVAGPGTSPETRPSSAASSSSMPANDGPPTAPLPSARTSPNDASDAPVEHAEKHLDEKNGEALTKIGAEQTLTIDVRATLVLDLFLLLLSDEVYDSRGRYLLRRLAEALKYPWIEVMRCERRVTQQLNLCNYATNITSATKNTAGHAIKERARKGRTKRLMIIGLATVGGGLVIGLSAGLLAPAIGAGIGATLGAIGITNTGAFFGSIGGTALITGAATLTGSGLAGSQIVRRTRFAEQFEFIPCLNEGQTNLILTIPGWLDKADNGVFSFSTLDPVNGDHYSLLWESEALRRLGSSLRMIVGEVFSITLTQTLQHTVLPSLLGPLSIPMWLAKLGYVLDNPWSNGCELAQKAGPVIADLLLQRVQGQRPVTLIGYSVGARLIFYTLLELANMNAYGLVEDVYLFGAPVVESEKQWRKAASVVGGRFVNAYSTKDWILGFFFRTSNLSRSSVAGLQPVTGVNGLENVDVSNEVPGHNAYREVLPILLHDIGVPVTSAELHDPNDKPGDSEDDRAIITELEKAAELLEEHEKKKNNIWPWRWPFWESGAAKPNDASAPPPPFPSAHSEADAAARELAELGINIKEVPSTLPALVMNGNSNTDGKRNTDAADDQHQ